MPEVERPRTVGDLMEFAKEKGLGAEEYFSIGFQKKNSHLLWTPETRWIAVYWVEGGSEGYYVHVDRLVQMPALEHLIVDNLALGKYWEKASAQRAVGFLTPWVYGLNPIETGATLLRREED